MNTSNHLPDFSLRGKLALITGSTQGLGLAIAHAYAASGARVVINGRQSDTVTRIVASLTACGYTAYGFVHDIGQIDQQQSRFDTLCHEVGTPDILVNNVGVRTRKTLEEASLGDILEHINVNLLASVHLSKLAATAMARQNKPGRLITLTSIAGELARQGDAIYPIAKQGLAGMVRSLAVEYGGRNITSNGIAPGTFATESNAALAADPVKGPIVVGRNPLGRWAQPQEITGAAVFLASPAASYVNGHIMVVDGGFSITF